MSDGAVAPDGSPVAVYLALPAGGVPGLVHDALPGGASVLDLGCGVGRIGGPLVGLGHRVVGVDDSADMLRHAQQRGLDVVRARVDRLDLSERFDAVLLLSHLINVRDPEQRQRLWSVCRRHARADGVVIVERHAPEWVREAAPSRARTGAVDIELSDVVHVGDELHATAVYTIGAASWRQPFVAVALDDDVFEQEARRAGLRLDRWLDERRELALLTLAPT